MNQALQDAINKAAPTVGMLPTDTITDDFLANLINALFRDILFFQNIDRNRRAETAMHILPAVIERIPRQLPIDEDDCDRAIKAAITWADQLWNQAMTTQKNTE